MRKILNSFALIVALTSYFIINNIQISAAVTPLEYGLSNQMCHVLSKYAHKNQKETVEMMFFYTMGMLNGLNIMEIITTGNFKDLSKIEKEPATPVSAIINLCAKKPDQLIRTAVISYYETLDTLTLPKNEK